MRSMVGDTRFRKAFLFFPKTIYSERRWWEVAEWEEQLDSDFQWFPIRWINE